MKLKRPKPPFSPLPPHVRAGQYVAKIPGAVAGSGGHNQTFAVAVALVHGFALPEAQAWPILVEYGATCSPPWSLPELRHKLASAGKATGHQAPRGHLIGTQAALVHYVASEPAPRVFGRVKMPAPRQLEAPAPRLDAVPASSTVKNLATKTGSQARPMVPSGWCPVCWSRWSRALRPGCCYCTGDVVPIPSSIRGVTKAMADAVAMEPVRSIHPEDDGEMI